MITDNLTLYVYYKIPTDKSNSCLLAVKQVHQAIAGCYPAISIRQQKRPDAAGNQETWMEIYDGIAPGQLEQFKADLLELVEAHGLPRDRKYEVFIDVSSD